MNDVVWLNWIGKRRPDSLLDQDRYDEQVSRPKAEAVAHKDPLTVTGHFLGRGIR